MTRLSVLLACVAIFLAPLSLSAAESNTLTNQVNQAGTFIADSSITAAVKAELLADKDIKSLSISVSTDNGVVMLKGKVANDLQKQKAIDSAKKVAGVKSVKDELLVIKK